MYASIVTCCVGSVTVFNRLVVVSYMSVVAVVPSARSSRVTRPWTSRGGFLGAAMTRHCSCDDLGYGAMYGVPIGAIAGAIAGALKACATRLKACATRRAPMQPFWIGALCVVALGR